MTATFEDALFLLAGALEEGVVVVFEETARPRRYLQFVQEDDALHAELVSDRFLPPELALGPDGAARLIELGWLPPDGDNDNWYTDLPWPAPAEAYRRLARQVVTTLTAVLGVGRPADLRYQAWQSATGRDLRLDALAGLDRLGLTRAADGGSGSVPGAAAEAPPVQGDQPGRPGDVQLGGGGEPRRER